MGKPMGKKLIPAVQVRNMIEKMVSSGALPQDKMGEWKQRLEDDKAVQALQREVDNGFPSAMDDLGKLYQEGGKGLKQDTKKAVSLYRRAADLGCAKAMGHLARLYNGPNFDMNQPASAVYWATQGAMAGDGLSMKTLSLMFRRGKAGLEQDDRLAFKWGRKLVDDYGSNGAYDNWFVGDCYARGIGTEINLEKAAEYMRDASISKEKMEGQKWQTKAERWLAEDFLRRTGGVRETRPSDIGGGAIDVD